MGTPGAGCVVARPRPADRAIEAAVGAVLERQHRRLRPWRPSAPSRRPPAATPTPARDRDPQRARPKTSRIVPEAEPVQRQRPLDHRLFVGKIEIGAAWTKTHQRGARLLLGLKLDDPSFHRPHLRQPSSTTKAAATYSASSGRGRNGKLRRLSPRHPARATRSGDLFSRRRRAANRGHRRSCRQSLNVSQCNAPSRTARRELRPDPLEVSKQCFRQDGSTESRLCDYYSRLFMAS